MNPASFIVGIIFYIICFLGLWKMFEKANLSCPFVRALVPFWNTYSIFKICWKPMMFLVIIILALIEGILAGSAIVHSAAAGLTGVTSLGYLAAGAGAGVVIIGIVLAVITIIMYVKLSKAFGHGVGWGILMWLFPWIMTMVTGFGASRYVGNPTN